MNKGKICVSVCAETADELIEQIKRAEDLADVIEIRFDCLNENEFDLALDKLSKLKCKKSFLATFRPKHKKAVLVLTRLVYENEKEKQAVKKAFDYRFSGWEKIAEVENINFVDFETDILDCFNMPIGDEPSPVFSLETDEKLKKRFIIVSEHYFQGVPRNLEQLYETMLPKESDKIQSSIVKIAAQADTITDTIAVWNLLEKAKSENKQIIPIAMGEAGKWTRILGLAHGAFMTYAALESGKETAPGQISAQDLIEIYRVKELNAATEVYGILGGNTSVSMSPYIHNTAFKFHNLNAVFVPLQVSDLDEFVRRMVKPETREVELNFKGFSVTIPHKQNIIKHLDFIDETAKKIGAVNTVKIIDGKLHGFNTDAPGFIEPLKNAFGDLRDAKVGVFGSGGAARACVYALKREVAEVVIFARNIEKAKLLAREFSADYQLPTANYDSFDIVVNATPLGMKGANENDTPFTAEQIKNVRLVYDLVYVPYETRFLREAKSVGVPIVGGLAMLISQAMAQFKIWTQLDAPMEEMNRIALHKLKS